MVNLFGSVSDDLVSPVLWVYSDREVWRRSVHRHRLTQVGLVLLYAHHRSVNAFQIGTEDSKESELSYEHRLKFAVEVIVVLAVMGALMILLALLNVPVAFAFVVGAVLVFVVELPIIMAAHRLIWSFNSFILLTVPFFITVGVVMNRGGITRRIFDFASSLVGEMPGGLAHVNVVASIIFAGMSGSANADAAGLGQVEIKGMVEAGYPRPFAAAITGASSIIGPIIPPSIVLVVYGAIGGVSVGALLLAGILPGLIMGVALLAANHVLSVRRRYPVGKSTSLKNVALRFKESFWALLTPVLLLGGIFSGRFSPTEAGAVAALYSLFISIFIYKELKVRELVGVLSEVGVLMSAVLFLVGTAKAVGWLLSWKGVPVALAEAVAALPLTDTLMLVVINLVLLVAGMFVSGLAILAIMVPLLIPIATAIGLDLVHFGIIVCVNIAIGGLTPPFGTVGYTTCMVGGVSYVEFIKELVPYLIVLVVALFIITFVPQLSLAIPALVY